MAGKNAKKRAKAERAGIRSLEMSRDMWRMFAAVSSEADALGATASLAEGCRVLGARAKYYLGEPENKNGLVRGELSREEWEAFQKLVAEYADVSPPLKAFAQAVGELNPDLPIIMKKMTNPQDIGGQAQEDALMICRPKSLRSLIEVLDFMILQSDRDALQVPISEDMAMALGRITGGPMLKLRKDAMSSILSARKKMVALLEDILKPDNRSTVPLMMSADEAKDVSGLFLIFKNAVHAKIEAPPEQEQGKKEMDDLLACAVRFFARIAGWDAALEELGS